MMVKNAIIQNDHLLSLPVELPVPGKVIVHLGQSVEPGDVIAEAVLPAKFQVFDVLNQFRIKETDLEGCIKHLTGEDVQRGDVIAKKTSLVSRIFRAPDAGKVVAVRDGRVTLAMGERTIQARTPIRGTVGEVVPGLGAVIVMRGLGLRGNWGNGRTAIGKLVMLNPDMENNPAEVKDAIIFRDGMAMLADLKVMQKEEVAGILVASLDPASRFALEQFEIPVMSLLGFGEATLDQLTKTAIEELQNSQVALVARKADPYRDLRPELFQPHETAKTAGLFAEPEPSLIGQAARLFGQPCFGSVGKIIKLPKEPERTASGILSQIAIIEREDGTVIRVPLDNLEILTDSLTG